MFWRWSSKIVKGAIKVRFLTIVVNILVLSSCAQLESPDNSNNPAAVKMLISSDGFYRINKNMLQQAGLKVDDISFDSLRLSLAGETVDYWIDDDQLIFFGQGPLTRYSRFRSYMLEVDKAGNEMEENSVKPIEHESSGFLSNLKHFEENQIYDGRSSKEQKIKLGYEDPWYWDTIQVQSQVKLDIEIPDPLDTPSVIRIGLWGVTQDSKLEGDHDFDLYINDMKAATVIWDGASYYIAQIDLEPGLLVAGSNEILIDNSIDGQAPLDIMRLDWIEVEYQSGTVLTGDSYVDPIEGGTFQIAGLRQRPLLFDVSNPIKPKLLTNWEYSDNKVKLELGTETKLRVIASNDYKKPDEIIPLTASDLKSRDNQADLIIVTTEELASALAPLVEVRITQGLSVVVATIEEVYDEFAYGQPGPDAINNFLRHAHSTWQAPPPRYVLLVGEATYDFRDYLNHGLHNIIPSPMVAVSFGGETVSDARLADVNDDLVPDLAIGRWPVANIRDVRSLVQRTLEYEQQTVGRHALFVADGSAQEFALLNQSIADESKLSTGSVEHLNGASSEEFARSWNEGPWLVTYSGHGSLDRWGKDNIFSGDAVSQLKTDSSPPITLQLTCLTGFFAHPSQSSLSEKMLLDENGPVLIVSATGLTLSTSQKPFGIELIKELQNPQVIRVGDALQIAKQNLDASSNPSLQEIIDTFGLLGDPSSAIARPEVTGSN